LLRHVHFLGRQLLSLFLHGMGENDALTIKEIKNPNLTFLTLEP